MTATVEILPQTDNTTLFVRLSGAVSADDYMTFFDAPVRKIAQDNGWYNLLVLYAPDFQGWSEQAASLSFKCITDIGANARRLAYVSPPDQRILLMKMMRPIIKAETRFFNSDEFDDAVAWMQSYRPT